MTDDEAREPRQTPALPVTLDRSALERVLARAAELQAAQAEPADGMSESQLIDVGNEVGIPAELVRQALAEERTRVAAPEATGALGEWFGSPIAWSSRIVKGTPAQLLATIDQWMQREETLRPKRRMPDRLTWEARRDLAGTLQMGLNLKGRAYALAAANEVGATVIAIDGARSMVRVDADFTESRRRRMRWSAVLGGGLLASAAALMAYTVAVPGSSALVGSVVGGVWTLTGGVSAAVIASGQRKRMVRAQLALEQILDRLEHGEMRKSLNPLAGLMDVVSKTVDGIR